MACSNILKTKLISRANQWTDLPPLYKPVHYSNSNAHALWLVPGVWMQDIHMANREAARHGVSQIKTVYTGPVENSRAISRRTTCEGSELLCFSCSVQLRSKFDFKGAGHRPQSSLKAAHYRSVGISSSTQHGAGVCAHCHEAGRERPTEQNTNKRVSTRNIFFFYNNYVMRVVVHLTPELSSMGAYSVDIFFFCSPLACLG